MLVLSRRPGEKFLFPGLGLSIEVLRSQGAVVRLRIDAPEGVAIIRSEIPTPRDKTLASDNIDPKPEDSVVQQRHAFRNRLNHLTLKLELLKRQLDVGRAVAPERVLGDTIQDLSQLENDLVEHETIPLEAKGCGVMVVEGQAGACEPLAVGLRLSGFDVVTVGDGAAALEYLRDHPLPELVLLDLRMPGIDGPVLLQAFRGDSRFKDLRIYAVCSSPQAEFSSSTLPIDGWFPMPLRLDALLHAFGMPQTPFTQRCA